MAGVARPVDELAADEAATIAARAAVARAARDGGLAAVVGEIAAAVGETAGTGDRTLAVGAARNRARRCVGRGADVAALPARGGRGHRRLAPRGVHLVAVTEAGIALGSAHTARAAERRVRVGGVRAWRAARGRAAVGG